MLKVTLRSFWEHKRRLVLTIVSIVLGVSFMAGTFVLSDTLQQALRRPLRRAATRTSTPRCEGEVLFSDPFSGRDQRALLPPSRSSTTVAAVRRRAGGRAATCITFGFGSANRVLDADGEPLGVAQGPPTLLESWIDGQRAHAVRRRGGPRARRPTTRSPSNVAAAEDARLRARRHGHRRHPVRQQGVHARRHRPVRHRQELRRALSRPSSPSPRRSGSPAPTAQVQPGARRRRDGRQPGAARRARSARRSPTTSRSLTGEEAAAELSSDVQEGFAFFTIIIQVFGVHRAARRDLRDLQHLLDHRAAAHPRAGPAARGRRQPPAGAHLGDDRGRASSAWSAPRSACVVGILLAQGLISRLRRRPRAGIVAHRPRRSLSALLIGLVVTLVAAIVPAIRATRVPPLAALRDVAIDRSGASKIRIGIGVADRAPGGVTCSRTVWTGDGTTDDIAARGHRAPCSCSSRPIIVGPVLAGPSVRLGGRAVAGGAGITGRWRWRTPPAARSAPRPPPSALLIGVGPRRPAARCSATSAKASIDKEVSAGLQRRLRRA